jgi:hypothetical protein
MGQAVYVEERSKTRRTWPPLAWPLDEAYAVNEVSESELDGFRKCGPSGDRDENADRANIDVEELANSRGRIGKELCGQGIVIRPWRQAPEWGRKSSRCSRRHATRVTGS